MACSIPIIGITLWNCFGTLLSKEYLSLWSVCFIGAEAWIWISDVTCPDSPITSLQHIVKTSPGLFLLYNFINWLAVDVFVKWTISGYFILKWPNVLCLLLCPSAYWISPKKNGCKDLSSCTFSRNWASSCSARWSVTLTWSLVNSTTLSSIHSASLD